MTLQNHRRAPTYMPPGVKLRVPSAKVREPVARLTVDYPKNEREESEPDIPPTALPRALRAIVTCDEGNYPAGRAQHHYKHVGLEEEGLCVIPVREKGRT